MNSINIWYEIWIFGLAWLTMCVVYRVEILVLVSAAYFYHFYIFYVQRLFIQIRFSELWVYFSAMCNEVIFLLKAIAKDYTFMEFLCKDWALYIIKIVCKLMSENKCK
jgi:hypothetical protein